MIFILYILQLVHDHVLYSSLVEILKYDISSVIYFC